MAEAGDYDDVEVFEDDDDQPIYETPPLECGTPTKEDPFYNDDDSNDSYDVLKDFGSIGKQYASIEYLSRLRHGIIAGEFLVMTFYLCEHDLQDFL